MILKTPAVRTPISLATSSDYEALATRAVTSVVNRYYDPTTGSFTRVDPEVLKTGQPYSYADSDPVNAVDSDGLDCGVFSIFCAGYDATAGGIKTAVSSVGNFVANHPLQAIAIIGSAVATVLTDGATSELLAEEISAVASDDAAEVTISQLYEVTSSETSTAGVYAGYVATAGSTAQTVEDCVHNLVSASCAIDIATLSIAIKAQLPSTDWTDAEKAIVGLGSSVLATAPDAFGATGTKSSSEVSGSEVPC